MESFELIKKALDETFKVKFKVIDVTEDKILKEEKKLFTKMLSKIEKLAQNEHKIFELTKIDTTTIVEPYWDMMGEILAFAFTEEVADILWWYVYERKNAAGEIMTWEDEDGDQYKFETPGDLYEYIVFKFDI
jgi:hypothetical protein